jgi:ferrous iron transport protein B
MWDRSKLFLRRAGTVILGINIILWFLATYPRSTAIEQEYAAKRATVGKSIAMSKRSNVEAGRPPTDSTLQPFNSSTLDDLDRAEAGEKLRHSFAGRFGRLIEPAIAPLGFDWKIGIGVVASFAAREVFVSTMSTVYNVGEADNAREAAQTMVQTLREQTRPDGTPLYTPLLGITLMVFYVFALQCVSTVAIVRRETNSWKWPLFQWAYMGVLAWVLAFLTWHGGRLLGFH